MIQKLTIIVSLAVIAFTASFISFKNQQTPPLTLNENPFITQSSSPPKIGLQAGHWKNRELPEELKKLRTNDGAEGKGKKEWEVNLKIAQLVAEKLNKNGIIVDILPATIPPDYSADAFIAIHADSHTDPSKNGFKASTSWYTKTEKSQKLLEAVTSEYLDRTKMPWEDTITTGMKGYYAFNWTRFKYSVNPETPAIIVENGFLTNAKDADFLINTPEIAAEALTLGILKFLKS